MYRQRLEFNPVQRRVSVATKHREEILAKHRVTQLRIAGGCENEITGRTLCETRLKALREAGDATV